MSIHLGSNIIKKLFIGSAQVKKAYLGSDLVYINALPVTYYVDTGTSYTEEVEPGQTVLSPTSFTPTKSGYAFVGWREDSTASSDVLSTKTMGDSPISLYAVFSKSVRLTKYNASNTASTEDKNIYYNNSNVVNPTFNLVQTAISGWTSAGWTTSSTGRTAEKAATSTVTLSSNATYYTIYTTTITLTKYNGSNTASTATGTRYVTKSATDSVQNPTFTLTQNALSGWTKAGWTNNASGYSATVADGGTVTLSANATYYTLYTASVTVTKYTNGSGGTSTESKNRVANVHSSTTYSNPSFTLTEPNLSGWTKAGWADAADYTADVANGGSVTLSANKTYYALYTASITVTYYNNSSTASTTSKNRIVRAGSSWSFSNPTFNLTVATVSGWSIRGWSTSNAANATISYNSATNFTRDSNCTLYASWTANVTVTYYNNSATASTSTKAKYRGYKGDVTAATFNLTEATVSGWTARGWSTSSGASAAISYNNATNFTRTSACTLYASWSKTVTISYNGNGNTGGSTASNTGTAYRGYKGDVTNASITLQNNGYSKTNYNFSKWAAGSTSGTQYAAGASYSTSSNTMMYAIWTIKPNVNIISNGAIVDSSLCSGTISINKDCNGSQGGYNETATFTIAQTLVGKKLSITLRGTVNSKCFNGQNTWYAKLTENGQQVAMSNLLNVSGGTNVDTTVTWTPSTTTFTIQLYLSRGQNEDQWTQHDNSTATVLTMSTTS